MSVHVPLCVKLTIGGPCLNSSGESKPFCMSDWNRVDSDIMANANTLLRRSNQICLAGPSVKIYYVTLDCRVHFSMIVAPDDS
jgi:hypothetical protein